ncbi:MAG: hypothetical protein HQL31_14390, partial [Planctomycetes bacterium]|nr:hypothetical protein [Planctomycetota bacterium]
MTTRSKNHRYSAERIRALTADRQPDIRQIYKVLRGEKPDRPTLFEFYLNTDLEKALVGPELAARF